MIPGEAGQLILVVSEIRNDAVCVSESTVTSSEKSSGTNTIAVVNYAAKTAKYIRRMKKGGVPRFL